MIFDRERLFQREALLLAPYGIKSQFSRGRDHPEPDDLMRTPFQKDRDRIIHSRAFRRLKMKTQVFVAHYGDHYRTRLTHSMEVAQISRDVARALGLNEDLAETIALAHDLGHTPFGHAGEETLNQLLEPFGLRFEHNEQSRCIVEKLECVYPNFCGLNLTFEVRQGLMKHQTPWDQNHKEFKGASLEAAVVNLADEIAYTNHDVDDGLRSGILKESELEPLALWQNASELVFKNYGDISDPSIRWSRVVSRMIGIMIQDLITHSSQKIDQANLQTPEDVYRSTKALISFSPQQVKINRETQSFLMKNLYFNPRVLKRSQEGQKILKKLFKTYYKKQGKLPLEAQLLIRSGEKPEIVIKDYIAGMTDEFAKKSLRDCVKTKS